MKLMKSTTVLLCLALLLTCLAGCTPKEQGTEAASELPVGSTNAPKQTETAAPGNTQSADPGTTVPEEQTAEPSSPEKADTPAQTEPDPLPVESDYVVVVTGGGVVVGG